MSIRASAPLSMSGAQIAELAQRGECWRVEVPQLGKTWYLADADSFTAIMAAVVILDLPWRVSAFTALGTPLYAREYLPM